MCTESFHGRIVVYRVPLIHSCPQAMGEDSSAEENPDAWDEEGQEGEEGEEEEPKETDPCVVPASSSSLEKKIRRLMFLKVDLKRKHKKNRRTRPQAKRQQQTRRQVRSRLMKAQVPSYQLELLLLASPIPPAMHHLRSQVPSPWAAWFNLDTVKALLLVYSSLLVGWAVHFFGARHLEVLKLWCTFDASCKAKTMNWYANVKRSLRSSKGVWSKLSAFQIQEAWAVTNTAKSIEFLLQQLEIILRAFLGTNYQRMILI